MVSKCEKRSIYSIIMSIDCRLVVLAAIRLPVTKLKSVFYKGKKNNNSSSARTTALKSSDRVSGSAVDSAFKQ